MNILLFGEYSGLFNCLKDGLVAIGHDVTLVSDGDGPKDYDSDFRWDVKFPIKPIARLLGYLNLIIHYKKIIGYDVVMFVSPTMSKYQLVNRLVYGLLVNRNKKSYLVSSGLYSTSFEFWYSKVDSKYYHYTSQSLEEPDAQGEAARYNKPEMIKWENQLFDRITGIIPIWYEYAEPYRNHPKLMPAIRIPINLNKYTYVPNIVKDKIVFFHGKTRACKGGRFIVEAFNRLRDKYKEEAEFVAMDKVVPFDEYIQLMKRVNVILDDANSYSFAMNVLFAMAQGKICMGGAEPEGDKELGYTYNPVFNITCDVNQICDQIEYIIKHKEKITEWGELSRKFVEEYHNYIEIAKDYERAVSNN